MSIVTTRLFGRLGNQLFQIANCIAYGIKHDIPYCIPANTLNNHEWKPYRFKNINYCENELRGFVYKEPTHSYREIPKFEEDVIVLEGYFQSEKYFSDYREQILKAFGFDNIETRKGVCSIHYRSGDYKLYPTRHPIISLAYLQSAITEMMNRGYRRFKVFSDDLEEAQGLLFSVRAPGAEIKYSIKEATELEDLVEMASCESNIIANSTYSWWAAWINPNKEKTVIVPKVWFGSDNGHLDTSTLIPESWIRM